MAGIGQRRITMRNDFKVWAPLSIVLSAWRISRTLNKAACSIAVLKGLVIYTAAQLLTVPGIQAAIRAIRDDCRIPQSGAAYEVSQPPRCTPAALVSALSEPDPKHLVAL
jgi:hypothetical protein